MYFARRHRAAQRSRTFALPILSATLLACAVFFSPVTPVKAQSAPALTFTNDGFTDSSYTGTFGWEFTANTQANLTAFGFFNDNTTLSKSYTVVLYDSSGNLLGSTSVGPSASDTKSGAFDYASLATPIALQSGHSYVVAALVSKGDVYYFFPGSVTTDPSVSYVQNRYDNAQNPALTFPTSSDDADSGKGYFGPSFMVAPAPEPSEWVTLALGLLGMAGLGLKARLRSHQ